MKKKYIYRKEIFLVFANIMSRFQHINILVLTHTAGKISTEHITSFLGKCIYKGTIAMKFSPDIGYNPSNQHMQRN